MSDSPDGLSLVSVTEALSLGLSRPGTPFLSAMPPAGRKSAARVDLVAANAAMHWLTASAEPQIVFQHLAQLSVPTICDIATVTVSAGRGIESTFTVPGVAESSTVDSGKRRARGGPPRKRATIAVRAPEVGGQPGELALGADFTATLTCTWLGGYQPTAADVALLRLLTRCAANVVHQARLAEQHQLDQERLAGLRRNCSAPTSPARPPAIYQRRQSPSALDELLILLPGTSGPP